MTTTLQWGLEKRPSMLLLAGNGLLREWTNSDSSNNVRWLASTI